jgi:hypothetical protein
VFAPSNYELKPLEITVFDGSDADHAALVRRSIELDDREANLLEEINCDPQFFEMTEAETVRFCFFRWYSGEHMRGPRQLKHAH